MKKRLVVRLDPATTADRSIRSAARAAVEPLESRCLLSVALPAAADDGQSPFKGEPFVVHPDGATTIEMEDFDLGGQDVAYSDETPENLGGAYRTDEAVDIKANADGGGYRLSNVRAGEWTEYTIDVEQGGSYRFDFAVSNSRPGGKFRLDVDGGVGTPLLSVPDTDSFDSYATVSDNEVSLSAGTHVLRLMPDANADNSDSVGGFDWMRISPSVPGQEPWDHTSHEIMYDAGGGIRFAEYDLGGEGVAFHDTTGANLGGAFRPDEAVDIVRIKNGAPDAYRLTKVAAGEWTEYTIYVDNAHVFDLEFSVGSSRPGGRFHAEVDGVDVTGTLKVPDTGSFDKLGKVTKKGVHLETGNHIFRMSFDRNADGSDSVGGFGGVSFTPAAEPTTVPVTTMTYVRDGSSATTNFGSADQVFAKRANGTGNNREILLKVDLGALGNSFSSVQLILHGGASDSTAGGVRVAAFGSTNTSWSENAVTWNNRPGTTGSALSTVTVEGRDALNLYRWEIGDFLRARKSAGKSSATIVLRGVSATSPYAQFNSDDASVYQPVLVVTP